MEIWEDNSSFTFLAGSLIQDSSKNASISVLEVTAACAATSATKVRNFSFFATKSVSEYNEEVKECAKNVAMQIAAMNPKYKNREEVPAEFIVHEKEILKVQTMNDPANQKKPENIIEKMIEGRLNKELKEI